MHQRYCGVPFSCRKSIMFNKAPWLVLKLFPFLVGDLFMWFTGAVQERLKTWLLKTQNFLNEFTSPLVKTGQGKKDDTISAYDIQNMEDIIMAEQTIDSRTTNGHLSLAAILSIEQFSRMNGLTGQKMQRIFGALVPSSVHNDARNLVEYCCFRFLSRDSSDIHPCLKVYECAVRLRLGGGGVGIAALKMRFFLQEPAFQKLIFVTMLAWEQPYSKENETPIINSGGASLQSKHVAEEAFVRIGPAVSGVADRSTVHNLFKALAGNEGGISLSVWCTYINELIKVHEGRLSYQLEEASEIVGERVLCIGSSRKRPVLKWEKNMAWPGKLTLTDKALYFEAVGFMGQRGSIRLDLSRQGSMVKKSRVGPFGSVPFDSAVSVSSGSRSETWVLEFVDLGGEMRRDVWHAFISEVIALYKFMHEYGPKDGDRSVFQVYGAHKGKDRARNSAVNSIARLQALQFMRKLLDDPIKLVQFSYLQNAPYGDIVSQALAVYFWGGPLIGKTTVAGYQTSQGTQAFGEISDTSNSVVDIDGSIYLRKWMRSPSWASNASISFWRTSSVRQGLVLSKNLVVADVTIVEKAANICKSKFQAVQKTQATIDAAMIEGIPNNIDLFKEPILLEIKFSLVCQLLANTPSQELLLPTVIAAKYLDSLRRWEVPHLTASFLAVAYTVIYRNLLSYVFPTTLILLGFSMLLLKALKEQGRLGRSFGKVTIRDQPPSNTIQKIIALKEAMRDVEAYLQNLNITFLKMRTIFLAGQPQLTTEIAMVLLCSAAVLLIVPFKYVISFLLFDIFTRELEFRREMVKKFMMILKERWDSVPAAPVVVLPYENDENRPSNQNKEPDSKAKAGQIQISDSEDDIAADYEGGDEVTPFALPLRLFDRQRGGHKGPLCRQ
ncbi:Protein of unknown function DUF639, partial [Dillenia turbinata]